MKGLAPAMAKGGHASRRSVGHDSRSPTPSDTVLEWQRHAGNHAVDRLIAARGSARPLPPPLRREMEARLGTDLQSVRIHDDATANQQAASLGARAVTVGEDIVFGEGRFAPDTLEGRRLIGHELVHVVQQRRGGTTVPSTDGTGPLEAEAGRVAGALAVGSGPVGVSGASAVGAAASPVSVDAYSDDELAVEWAKVAARLEQKEQYSGRELDLSRMTTMNREIERRNREQAIARAMSYDPDSDDDDSHPASTAQNASWDFAPAGSGVPGHLLTNDEIYAELNAFRAAEQKGDIGVDVPNGIGYLIGQGDRPWPARFSTKPDSTTK